MTITQRFDPIAGEPHSSCTSCDYAAADEDDMREHLRMSFESSRSGRSHSMRITNPSRKERIDDFIETVLVRAIEDNPGDVDIISRELEITDEAVDEALYKLETAVENNDLTAQELTAALKGQPEFLAAWKESELCTPDSGADVPVEIPNQGELFAVGTHAGV